MTQELTQEQMRKMGVSQGAGFKTLRVDNGDDKLGSNATGEWVIKSKNGEGTFERQLFGKTIKGVFLAARAKVFSKYTEQAGAMVWYSDEFNPLDSSDVFNAYTAKEKAVKFTGTYKELQKEFTFSQAGQIVKLYTYKTYLYFLVDGEILKLELSGKSQGNWIEHNIKNEDLLKIYTECEIVVHEDDKGTSFMATFRDGESCADLYTKNLETMMSLPERKAVAPQAISASAPTPELPPSDEGVPLPTQQGNYDESENDDAIDKILAEKGMV